MKKKDNFLKHSFGTIVNVAVGGAALNAVANSPMNYGLKTATEVGISAGIASNALGKHKNGKKWF